MDDIQTWYIVACAEFDLFSPIAFREREAAERYRKEEAKTHESTYTFGILEAKVNLSTVNEMKGWIGG